MAITLRIESPVGTPVANLGLSGGQNIRVTGKVVALNWGNVRMQIFGEQMDPIQDDAWTNLVGNYWFDLTLPNVDTIATVAVISGGDQAKATIGIRRSADLPGALPPIIVIPPTDIPTPRPGIADTLGDIMKYGKWVALGVVALVAVSALKPK